MNRIEPSVLELLGVHHEAPATSRSTTQPAPGLQGISCFTPMHYEPNYAYPLLVWLHGEEGDERSLSQVMPEVSTRNFAAVAPRLSHEALQQTEHGGRYANAWEQEAELAVERAERRVFRAIEAAEARYHISPERIFLVGWGGGGSLALRIALAHPERFLGVASLGGEFPKHGRPLRRLDDIRELPLFLACGRDSQRYNEAAVCGDLRLLHTAGMSLTLRQYPVGDELTSIMLSDLNRWVMEQVCPGSAE